MNDNDAPVKVNAARAAASTFGILGALGGLLHGIGEVLQGNVAPDGIVIPSWTQGPIAEHMGGDPGMTIVPNLLVTGILAILVSLAVIVWSIAGIHRKHGGLILILLSTAMLLVGGGFGPPVIGILAGVAGLGVRTPYAWWRNHLPATMQRTLAALWPWVFGASAVNGAFLFIGHVILVCALGVTNAAVFLYSFYFAILSLCLTILTGIAYDLCHGHRPAGSAK